MKRFYIPFREKRRAEALGKSLEQKYAEEEPKVEDNEDDHPVDVLVDDLAKNLESSAVVS